MASSNARSGRVLAVVASVVAGCLVAVQSRVNGQLGVALEDGALAALISFSSGFLVLALAMVFSAGARRGLHIVIRSVRSGELDFWALLGGLGGAFLVLSQGLTAGVLGVALFSVAVVAGQTLGALGIDSRGLLGSPAVAPTPLRLVGAALVLVGVIVGAQLFSAEVSLGPGFLLPLCAGVGTGVQQALNGRVREQAGSAIAATFINFAVGTIALALATAIISPLTGGPASVPTEWWLYSGGFVGAIFIAIQTVTVRRIGVLVLGVSLVTGQVIASVALDWFAPVAAHPVTVATVVGALLAVAGSVMVTVGKPTQS